MNLKISIVLKEKDQNYQKIFLKKLKAYHAHISSLLNPLKKCNKRPLKSPTKSPTKSIDPVNRLLLQLKNEAQSSNEIMTALALKHHHTFRKNYLHPTLKAKFSKVPKSRAHSPMEKGKEMDELGTTSLIR